MSYTQRGSQARTQTANGANGEIQCKCNPPRNAVLLQTRKEGPNLDRYFYKCDGGHCKFFQWQDELDKSQKHQPTLTPARGGSFPASSNGNRLGSAPARAAPVTPFKPTASRKRRASSELELEASLGSSSAQADVDDDDDIEVVGEPSTPSKQAKFTSFSTPSASARRTTTGGCEYDAIMADPTSPFHARHASLFGSSSAGAGSNVAVPTSSAGGVQGIVATLATVGPMLEDLQKELEKKDRLIKAGDKKSAGLKKKLEEAEAECETLRSKAHLQGLEIAELRTRIDDLEN